MTDYPITLPDSPIEFALIGPRMGRDRVLVQSEKVGLDLIGLAAESGLRYSSVAPITRSSSNSDGKLRKLNLVTSRYAPDLYSDVDSRTSHFSFAWNGYASPEGLERVKKSLDHALPDLHKAVQEGDLREIEWTLSPIVVVCTEANERGFRRKRMLRSIALVYGGLVLLAVLIALLNQLFT
jgi:hypothetical protein